MKETYDISYKDILANLTSLFYEFKDSTVVPCNEGTKLSYIKSISPLFYNKIIDTDSNTELLTLITSAVPYYYLEPKEMISNISSKNIIENILQDTRDSGINDVPSIFQDSEFWNTWFRDTWGTLQNNMLLDIYNKLQYPFINENHFLNMSLFPKLANEIYREESNDSESWLQFMDTEEENDSVYRKEYKFLGEETGCLDYIEDIVNQKTLSNYFIIDYSSSQDELLDKWSESLYASGQMGREDLDMERRVFKLQDCKNELIRRKFAGSLTLFQTILESIGRKGSYITTCTVSDVNAKVSMSASTKALTSFNDKRKCKLLNIPGLISEPYDFTSNGDLIDTYYTKLDSIPINTLLPVFYTSATIDNVDFSIENFFKDSSRETQLYRNKYLRDNISLIDWTNLKGINFTENIASSYDTLDMVVFNEMGEKENVTLDSEVVEEGNKIVTRYLDKHEPLVSPKHVSSGVSDVNTDRILYHRNTLQSILKEDYPYVTYPFADGNSLSLIDSYWLNYMEREMSKKSKAQDFFKVGAQINTLLKVEPTKSDKTATYSFFGISYTSKDASESTFDNLEMEEYSSNTKYALLWYCTLTYTVDSSIYESSNGELTVTQFEKTLISKIKLRPSESFVENIPSKYRDDSNFESKYLDYIRYNLGVLPNTYPSAKNNVIWNNDIGFSTVLRNFDTDLDYFELRDGEYIETEDSYPLSNKIYYTRLPEGSFETAMDFSDDINELGYSKARFVFCSKDTLLNKSLSGLTLTTDEMMDNTALFNENLCSIYPSEDTKLVFYTMERRNSLEEVSTYWSDPIKVVSLSKLDTIIGKNFQPDWMGLEYYLNPYLNYVTDSASPLRRYKGYSQADLLKEELPSKRNFGPSSETALCNLNRTRGRIVLCNDNGSDTLLESSNTYGYFLDRVPLYEDEDLSQYTISESLAIKGDNRTFLSVSDVDTQYDLENVFEIIRLDIYTNPDSFTEYIKEQLAVVIGKSVLYTVIIYENESRVNYKIKYFLVNNSIKEEVDYNKITNDRYTIYRDSNGIECLKVYPNKIAFSNNRDFKYTDTFFRIVPFSHKSGKDISSEKEKWHWNEGETLDKTLGIHISFEDMTFIEYKDASTFTLSKNINNYVIQDGEIKIVFRDDLYSNNLTLIKDSNMSLAVTSQGKVKFEVLGVLLESERVLPLDNVESLSKVHLRIMASVSEDKDSGNLSLTLCVNDKIYSKEGAKTRNKENVEYISLFSEPKEYEGIKDPVSTDCFYGNVYEISLYNKSKSDLNLRILNYGSQRELYSFSPSNYKLAHSIYRDFAFLKKYNLSEDKERTLPNVNAIRIFNRGVWDSIFVDNYPLTSDETLESSIYYNKDIRVTDPYDDTDVYTPIIKDKEVNYILSDCIEQDLISNFEVYNGLVPKVTGVGGSSNSLSVMYKDSEPIYLTSDSEVQIINTLIEPISYNNYPMKSSEKLVFTFNPSTKSIQQLNIDQPEEVNNFIVVPSKADSSDDSFEYSADLDFNMYMYPEFDASKWLSKGANIVLGYNSSENIYYTKLSDNTIKSSEKNNVLLPLVIPPQESSLKNDGSKDRRIFLDRLLAKNLLLSNSFKTLLNATSYYTEVRIPYAVNTIVETYEKSLGKRLYPTESQRPVQGRTYYRMKNILSVNDLRPIYKPEYVANGAIYEWTGEGEPPLGEPTVEESILFVKVNSMKRGVTYFKINDGDSSFSKLTDFTPFDASYTDESLYFTLEEGEFVPYNNDYFDVNATYYHEYKDIYPYEKFELLSKVPNDRGIYDSSLTLLYNSDNKTNICIKDIDGSYQQFTEDYFSKDIDYFIGTYSNGNWTVNESSRFRFTSESPYFEKVIISGKEYYNRLSLLNVNSTIYSMTYTKLTAGSNLSASKTYYEYKDGEYVIAEGTYFDTEETYYEDRLGDKNFYKLVGDSYEKIKSEAPTYENWNVERDGYIYDKITTNNIEYVNKWDALRTLKEGTYYFTCKYPLQILPFKEDELDLPNRKYATYYASTRFKIQVTSSLKEYSEEDYEIEGYPTKYQSNNLEATLKSASNRENPSDNRTFPHRVINIDLYAIDCTETAGMLNTTGNEGYTFSWKKIASNHPTSSEIEGNILLLDRDCLEKDTFIKSEIPLFFSESYTSPFFIAGRDKTNNNFNPTSADDDFIFPIEILDGENDLSKESLEYLNSNSKSSVLLSGKTYQVLLDYDAYVGEISYTSRVYINFKDEKVNFARLVNLTDSSTVSENEYLYNTDGRSFNESEISAITGNTGFKVGNSSSWEMNKPYFGNPYSKSSNNNLLLKNKKAISGMGLAGKDARTNINNAYTFPYSVVSSHTIPAYPTKIGAVSSNGGTFIEMNIREFDITKYHYDNIKSQVQTSITSLRSNSDGLFAGISKITPNFVNYTNNSEDYSSINSYIGLEKSNYDIYGYTSSRRLIPSGDKNVTITRRSLYSNTLLETNSFDMSDIWTVSQGSGRYERDASMDKDVYKIQPSGSIWLPTSTSKLNYIYGRGGTKYTAKFEVAINLKGNIKDVYAKFTVNGKEVTGNYDSKGNYLGKVRLTSDAMEGGYSGWKTWSAETPQEIDADGVSFEIISERSQPYYVASAFVRKCNYISHKLGLADALNDVILTSGLSGVTIKEHSSVIVKMSDSDTYYPIQFNNNYVKSISSGGVEVYRPMSGVSKIAEFISNYKDTRKKVEDSRLQSMIVPWQRRLYIRYTNGQASVSVHRYGLLPNYLGALELQEIHDNTSDVVDTLGEEMIEGKLQKKLQVSLMKNEASHNFNIFLSRIPLILNEENQFNKFGCNLRLDRKDASQDFEAMTLTNERFSVIFNAFDSVSYKEGIEKPLAITNVQLIDNSSDTSKVLYELEYLPIVYSELRNHVSFNILLYV